MKAHPALVATVFVAVLAGIWDQLWVPWSAERDALESTVAEARELNVWVTEKIPLLSVSGSVQLGVASGSAAQSIQSSLRRFGLSSVASRIEPKDGAVRVTLERALFDTTLAWIAYAEGQAGLKVTTMVVDSHADAGFINGTLEFGSRRP